MRKSEITLQLPPAELRSNGDIYCREYPLVLYGSIDAPIVYVDNIDISPGTGVVEILMTGEGVEERRHSIGVGASRLPQAAATEMKPLEMRIMNLNPDSSVHVVISTTAVERLPIGTPESFGGAVRFRGSEPLGTDGKREANYLNRDNDDIVIADGPLWKAYFTRNSAVSIRNIRDITSQVRVLSATGTGKIGVSGGTKRMIIVKKDGVTLEVEAESLDFRNIFDIELPSSGNVQILGLLANAIATHVIQNGAITDVKIATGAVTNAKLATGAVTTAKVADDAITPAKLDRAYSVTSHNHSGIYSPVSHTHTSSSITNFDNAARSAVNGQANYFDFSYGGDVVRVNWLIGGNGIKPRSTGGRWMYLDADFGTNATQVARGNHVHDPNHNGTSRAWDTTHVTSGTPYIPRATPGSDAYAMGGTIANGVELTRLGTVSVAQGGLTWVQCHLYSRGFFWYPLQGLTAL